mgnify:CR=1 FL=1
MIKSHKITVEKTAHYYTLGKPSKSIKYCWIVTHGYGQLAENIIQKFNDFDLSEHFIIAPDALNRFYWKGVTGQVASSWMTRKDRLDEIDDYANYLTQIYEHFIPQLSPDVQINLFGFSQGVATQFRWMMAKKLPFHYLILWAGFVPEDLNYQPHLDYFEDKQLTFLYGDDDRFLTPERLAWHKNMVAEKGLVLEEIPFVGKHVVDRKVLNKLVDRIC